MKKIFFILFFKLFFTLSFAQEFTAEQVELLFNRIEQLDPPVISDSVKYTFLQDYTHFIRSTTVSLLYHDQELFLESLTFYREKKLKNFPNFKTLKEKEYRAVTKFLDEISLIEKDINFFIKN